MADEFFAAVVRQAKLHRYMSSDHFSVDGTLLEAWALRYIGNDRNRAWFKMTTAVYNLIRITALDAATAS